MNTEIHEFAATWLDKFRDPNHTFGALIESRFGEECRCLGFLMDCGESFSAKYGTAAYDYMELDKVIDMITDVELLGSAIYSRWRYFNHWTNSGEEITNETNRAWFILALSRLALLTGNNPFLFSGTLKKIRIVSNSLGYGPMPGPEEEIEQHLTINADGMVWFSGYNCGGWDEKRKQLRRQQFKISQANTTKMFEAFEQYFSNGYDALFATDIGNWELELTNTEGTVFKFRGSLCSSFDYKGTDLSDMVREAVGMGDLYVFDGNVAPDIITRLTIDYHRVTKIDPADDEKRNLLLWDYTEQLIIDRKTETLEHIRNIGTGCKVSQKYEIEEGVSELLDYYDADELFTVVEGNPEDVMDDPNNTKDYVITIEYKKGPKRIISGSFDKKGLPNGYANFIEEIADFMLFYGMGELFNSSLYNKMKRRNTEYIFCSVEFDSGNKSYYYLTEDDTIQIGDFVVVPVGHERRESVAEVVNIEYFEADAAPYPVDKIKKILRKYDSE